MQRWILNCAATSSCAIVGDVGKREWRRNGNRVELVWEWDERSALRANSISWKTITKHQFYLRKLSRIKLLHAVSAHVFCTTCVKEEERTDWKFGRTLHKFTPSTFNFLSYVCWKTHHLVYVPLQWCHLHFKAMRTRLTQQYENTVAVKIGYCPFDTCKTVPSQHHNRTTKPTAYI